MLRFEFFISRRTLHSESQGKKVSKPILRIATLSITLAVVVNLLTLAIVKGFKSEIRTKLVGFGSHMLITDVANNSFYEGEPIQKKQEFVSQIKETSGVKEIFPVAYKAVIFQSDDQEKKLTIDGKDSSYTTREIKGAVLKGLDATADLSFFKENLVSGRLPHLNSEVSSSEILISQDLAKALNIALNQEIRAFFIKQKPIKRFFKVVGIYRTGLEEFDDKIALTDIRNIQQISDWGITAHISIEDSLINNKLLIKAIKLNQTKKMNFDWGKGFSDRSGFLLTPTKDTTIRLIVSIISGNQNQIDTGYLLLKKIQLNTANEGLKEYTSDNGLNYRIQFGEGAFDVTEIPGSGTCDQWVTGFELNVKDWDQLEKKATELKKRFNLIPTEHGETMRISTIKENQADLFLWLDFLDINVVIIVLLMILIGVINMSSALLVLILSRTSFIGILKAMGAPYPMIRKIFILKALYIILKGVVLGNTIGLLLYLAQKHLKLISLDPNVYYLNKVPMLLTFTDLVLLNVIVIGVCLVAMLIPSLIISRIKPAQSIKFN